MGKGLDEVELIHVRRIGDQRGVLSVLADRDSPIRIRRAFLVEGYADQVRGGHAHRQCTQVLIAVHGTVVVQMTDGYHSHSERLSSSGEALIVPPKVWATQSFWGDDSKLLVLCDQVFEEADYIRSFEDFLAIQNGGA